jgi:hypothetical protein
MGRPHEKSAFVGMCIASGRRMIAASVDTAAESDVPVPVASREDSPMHALMITFTSAVPTEDLREPFRQTAEAVRAGGAPGLISKTWLVDGSTLGGFHLFEDRAGADGYLEGMFAAAVPANPAFTDIRIQRFEVAEEPSAITNGLPAALLTVGD